MTSVSAGFTFFPLFINRIKPLLNHSDVLSNFFPFKRTNIQKGEETL